MIPRGTQPLPALAVPLANAILVASAEQPRELTSPTVLGSDPRVADIVIGDRSVAATHAVVQRDPTDPGRWTIRDLGAAATWVDGVPLSAPIALSGRHEVVLGRTRLTILVEAAIRIVAHAAGATLVRGPATVALDPPEVALLHALAVAQPGYVRASELAHLVRASDALAAVRQLVRRCERKLAALGEPPVLETCERRGYRLRAALY